MIPYAGEDVQLGEYSYNAGGNAKLYSHFGNQYGGFLENGELISLRTQQYHSWAYTHRMLTHTTNICSTMFVIARTWKQLRYPSTEEWIKKIWYTYYSAVQNYDFLKSACKWMEPRGKKQPE